MGILVTWTCDYDGCEQAHEVVVRPGNEPPIDGKDAWPPGKWGGIDNILCPHHEAARIARLRAEMKPGEVWTA